MAVTGNYLDHYSEMFNATLTHELQKAGSRLKGVVKVENLSGNKAYFDKIGKKAAYLKTQRAQEKTYADTDFERRLLTFSTISYDEILDVDDMARFVSDPTSDIMEAAVKAVGRYWDEIVFAGITGTANIQVAGVASTATITNTINVNDHDYDPAGGTNDIGLTDFKLRKAKKLLLANYADAAREPLIVLAPASQLAILSSQTQLISGDYRSKLPLDMPGLDQALSGFLGFEFIQYEDTGLSGTDELVYIFPKSAVRVGINRPMTSEMIKNPAIVGNPLTISVTESIGAVRMHDEAVIKVVCDPTVAKSA